MRSLVAILIALVLTGCGTVNKTKSATYSKDVVDSLINVVVRNSEKELAQKITQDVFLYTQGISEINEHLDFEITVFDTSAGGGTPVVSMIIKGNQHKECSSKTSTTDSVKTSADITERESHKDSSTTYNYTSDKELLSTNETVVKENQRGAGRTGWIFLGICIACCFAAVVYVVKVKLLK